MTLNPSCDFTGIRKMIEVHRKYSLSERLIRTISSVRSLPGDTVESLIGKGADVNIPHDTLLPLHSACMVCDADCIELLLENGANVNAKDGYQRTALHYAAEKDEMCVEILLEYGANPNALDGNQDTPLHWAAFKNMDSCVLVLLEGGAKANAVDYNQDTPLSWAVMKGNLESVRLLLDYGALPDTTNLKGMYPAGRLAALMGRGLGGEREEQCLELLHRACGNLRMRREGGVPPEAARHAELCQRLLKLCSEPGSLKALARRVVRRSLGERLLSNVVTKLPVPKSIQNYLLLIE
ncbi:ankyrin repeat and SOCS box protein 8 isoform X1 [Rana temporaria]|uniref:ankyrin repeat and SOCS box protein 8 isoform X1 n=2 Tax=Rana temporaria TaxID=8407 RepID=UPI001AADED67|nr:ankyrin repeat and SOCS box protein 8 isoform X1 [Rana temporaria]XP_040212472.1 ankyrin repeat and SOCS box protein 8 isoform X1 [Rana temporaria]